MDSNHLELLDQANDVGPGHRMHGPKIPERPYKPEPSYRLRGDRPECNDELSLGTRPPRTPLRSHRRFLESSPTALGCHRYRLDRRVVSRHAAGIRTVSLCRRRMAPIPQPREPPVAHRQSHPGLLLVRDLVFNSNLHQSAHRADTPPRQTLPRRDRRPQNLPAGPAHPGRQHGSVPDPVHEQTTCHVDHLVQHRVSPGILRIRRLGAQGELEALPAKSARSPRCDSRRKPR